MERSVRLALFLVMLVTTASIDPRAQVRSEVARNVIVPGCIAIAQNADIVAARVSIVDTNDVISVYEAKSGSICGSSMADVGFVDAVALSPTGEMVALARHGSGVQIRETRSGEIKATIGIARFGTFALQFSSDANMLAGAQLRGPVIIWDIAAGKIKQTIKGKIGIVKTVAFSPDISIIATGGDDSVVSTWDVKTGRKLHSFGGQTGTVRCSAFSSNGTILATGGDDTIVRLWNVASGRLIRTLVGHAGRVRAVAFSRDGSLVATAADDATVRLWDIATGQATRRLEAKGDLRALKFSENSRLLSLITHEGITEFNLDAVLNSSTQSATRSSALSTPKATIPFKPVAAP